MLGPFIQTDIIMNKHLYDNLDRQIIALLRNDGRASLSKLADTLNVSRGTVQNRLERLQTSGILLGFTVRVREESDLDSIRAFMMIEVVGKSTTQVIRALGGLTELIALHSTNGAWNLVAEIQASSLAVFDRVLRDVREIDGVLNSETSILLSSV